MSELFTMFMFITYIRKLRASAIFLSLLTSFFLQFLIDWFIFGCCLFSETFYSNFVFLVYFWRFYTVFWSPNNIYYKQGEWGRESIGDCHYFFSFSLFMLTHPSFIRDISLDNISQIWVLFLASKLTQTSTLN